MKFICTQLVNCGLSNITIEALSARGITALFPIQKHVYEPAAAGRDLIGRARTGSGKTLAFALPVVEKILAVSLVQPARSNEVYVVYVLVFSCCLLALHLEACCMNGRLRHSVHLFQNMYLVC